MNILNKNVILLVKTIIFITSLIMGYEILVMTVPNSHARYKEGFQGEGSDGRPKMNKAFPLVVRSSFVFASSTCDWVKLMTSLILLNHRYCLQKQMEIEHKFSTCRNALLAHKGRTI